MPEKDGEKEKKTTDSHVEGDKARPADRHEHEHDGQKKGKKREDLTDEVRSALETRDREIRELKERLLYQQAEFENFKKLKAKEKQDVLRFGNEAIVRELLPVIDNLERAVEHASKADDPRGITEGVVLTLNGFLKVLEKSAVSRVEALGKKFDPNLHEAVYQEERDDVEGGTIVGEFQKGYVMDGRLLRPSMVAVAKKPETE